MIDSEDQIIKEFVQAMLAGKLSGSETAEWSRQLDSLARIDQFNQGDVLVQHHAQADDIHFLIEGALRYTHLVNDEERGEMISHERTPWMPIGWSSLNFRRYRVTIVAESDGRLLTLPLAAWQELSARFPTLWAYLSEFMFLTTTQTLWEARDLNQETYSEITPSKRELAEVVNFEPGTLEEMYQQSPCFSALPVECRQWLVANSQLFQAAGRAQILQEREASGGLWLLQAGRVAMRFTIVTEKGQQTAVRYAVRTGTLLCWSGTGNPVPAPYQIESTRDTKVAFVPSQALASLVTENPQWLGAIFQQQLWQLRRYLRTTRTQYTDAAGDGGIRSLSNLIEDSKPLLPVDSVLYGVPYLLKNRLTRQEGFQRLYQANFEGTRSERAVASLALDILREFERAHRFFMGLKSTYAAVIRNKHLPPPELRKVVSRNYRDALAHVPYAIKGLENLPDDPNFIFIYNHMAYGEDALLPNGFFFNPDSHFISHMIAEPKYGDGIRVSRANDSTEFWREDYYQRLGHISVVTPESGWLNETSKEKKYRKEKFYADCQGVLASGLPFIIAPEGNITEEDSITEKSPARFKPGAFLMSARFPSKPKIVPVAFANFDKPIYRTIFSCVIKPAFSMEERGLDVNDRASMSGFLKSYQKEFRGYVEEAIELGHQVEAPGADLTGIATNIGQVDTVYEEFELDVRALEHQLGQWGNGKANTVFYGSSTFRLWDSLAEDVAIPGVVNLGFGGSTLEACRLYFERLLLPFQPNRLVMYGGENDIGQGASAEFVVGQFRHFADMIQNFLPETDCWFISLKPSPARLDYLEETIRTNTLVAAEIEQREKWSYIDIFKYMLDQQGRPNTQLFTPDLIHLNIAGYGILAKVIRQVLSRN